MKRIRRAWCQLRPCLGSLGVAVGVIALGIALAAGMLLATAALRDSFRESAEALAGKADLQILPRSGNGHFPASVLEEVRAVDGVAAAAPMLARNGALDNETSEVVRVIGIDMLDDSTVRVYERSPGEAAGIEDPLVFLNQPDSTLIPAAFARELGVGKGDSIGINTPQGRKYLTVRGIIGDGGVGRTFGGRLAVMDLFSAQDLFAAPDRLSQIDLRVEDGADVDTVAARIAPVLPVALSVRTVAEERERLAEDVRAFQQSMDVAVWMAVLLAVLITANRLSMVYEARSANLGIMRAIGAPPVALLADLLTEALLLGVLACAIGLPLGVVFAGIVVGPVSDTMVHNFKQAISLREVPLRVDSFLIAGGAGIGSAVLAAYLPARRAVRESVRRVLAEAPTQGVARARPIVRIARLVVVPLAAVLFLLQVFGGVSWLAGPALGLILPACLLLLTPTLRLAGRVVGGLGGNARLGVRDLRLHERRAVGATATLVVGLVMVVQFSCLRSTISHHLQVNRVGERRADLVVDQALGKGVSSDTILRFDSRIAEELREVPGVARVGMEVLTVNQRKRTGLIAIDYDWFFSDEFGRWQVEDAAPDARHRVAEGDGFFVSRQILLFRDLEIGDLLRLDTPSGPLERPILGILNSSMVAAHGDVTMTRDLFVEYWQDPTITHAFVRLEPGADPEAIRERIRDRFVGRYDFRISNLAEFEAWQLNVVAEGFAFASIMIALTLLVVAVGTSDTLAALVLERRRQIGTMRAMGAAPASVGGMVAAQALIIGLAGGTLGLVGGVLFALSLVQGVFRHAAGWYLDFHVEPSVAVLGLAVGIGACMVGAVAPALRAAAEKPAMALRYE